MRLLLTIRTVGAAVNGRVNPSVFDACVGCGEKWQWAAAWPRGGVVGRSGDGLVWKDAVADEYAIRLGRVEVYMVEAAGVGDEIG